MPIRFDQFTPQSVMPQMAPTQTRPTMQGLLGALTGGDGYGEMVSDDARKAAQRQGLLAFGSQMLQASGPSPVRTSLGQAIGRGITAGQGATQQGLQAALQAQLMQGKIAQANAPKIIRVDRGDTVDLIDERSGEVVASLPKGASPDAVLREEGAMTRHGTPSGSAVLGSETTIRGQNLSADTTRRGQDIAERTAIRGQDLQQASRDAKAAESEQARQKARQQAIASSQGTLTEIDKALDLVDKTLGGGFTRSQTSKVPGSDAYTLRQTIGTIRANIGFDRLQAMRDASPTGGALGQVAIQELEALQNSIAALDVGLPDDVLKANLEKVKTHYRNWLDAVRGAESPNAASGNIIDWSDL